MVTVNHARHRVKCIDHKAWELSSFASLDSLVTTCEPKIPRRAEFGVWSCGASCGIVLCIVSRIRIVCQSEEVIRIKNRIRINNNVITGAVNRS